jgi:hypothetical protein
MAEADGWGVFADEVKIFATSSPGAAWWALYISRQPPGRVTCLAVTPQGCHWYLACDNRGAAEMVLEAIAGHGVKRKFLKVATRSACLKAAAARCARHEGESAAIASLREQDHEPDEAWSWWVNSVMPDPFTEPEAHQRGLQAIGYPCHARQAVLGLYRAHKLSLEGRPLSLAGVGGGA